MKLQTARGVKDIPPEEKILKNKVVEDIRKKCESYGFSPLETPLIERFETLAAKGGAGQGSDVMKEVFKLTDQGKRKLGLRFDLTVPLARYVSTNPTLKLPFKRYQVGRVYRDGPIKLGRTREFWQFDADIIGTNSMVAEAELIFLAENVFKKLGLQIIIKINNRKILNGVLEKAGFSKKEAAIIAIDKLEKIGKQGVSQELEEKSYNKKQISALFNIIQEGNTLNKLAQILPNNEGIKELKELLTYLKPIKSVQFEISLARGLAYYTGTVYEIFMKKGKISSSIGSGGRYDDMIGNFLGGNRIVPAVGISFGLVPIIESIKENLEKNKQVKQKTTAQALVLPINTTTKSLQIAEQLRKSGINIDFAMGKKGVTKNLQYASALGIPFTIIIGENEIKKQKLLLRNMKSGSENLLTISQVIKKLK